MFTIFSVPRKALVAAVLAWTCSCGLGGQQRAQAVELVFDYLDLFESATGATITELPNLGDVPATQVVGSLTFSEGPGATNMFMSEWTSLIPGYDLALSGVEDFNVVTAAPVTSFGFGFVEPSGGAESTFTVTLRSGTTAGSPVVDSFTFAKPNNVLTFVGVTTDSSFQRVEVRETTGAGENEYFGTFFTGNTPNKLWTAGSGDWGTGANWSGGSVPTDAANVFINPASAGEIITASGIPNGNSFYLGNGATLELQGGIFSVEGDIIVNGATFLESTSTLFSLDSGRRMTVAGGGVVDLLDLNLLSGSTSIVVRDADSSFTVGGNFTLGYQSLATLRIEGGGHTTTGRSTVGYVSGGDGNVTVQGSGSTWDTGALYLGYAGGDGTLDIEEGGSVTSDSTQMNLSSGGSSSVSVSGNASWEIAGDLDAGWSGANAATLNVSDGGSVVVGGTATFTYNSTLHLTDGLFSAATLIRSNDGAIHHEGGTLRIVGGSFFPGGSNYAITGANLPRVELDGATWSVSNNLYVGGDAGSQAEEGAELAIDNGATLTVGNLTKIWDLGEVSLVGGTFTTDILEIAGNLAFTGGRLNALTIIGNLEQDGGVFSPGGSVGIANMSDDYSFFQGTFLVEMAGNDNSNPNFPQYDSIQVIGDVSLGGSGASLGIEFLNGFVPSFDDTYTVIDAGSIDGFFDVAFSGERIEVSDGFGSFLVHYGAGSPFGENLVVLSEFLSGVDGDYNNDGKVGPADYTVYRNHLGEAYQLLNEDPDNMDGMVTLADYDFWKLHYGDTPGSGSSLADGAANIPEPSSFVLLALAIALFSSGRGKNLRSRANRLD